MSVMDTKMLKTLLMKYTQMKLIIINYIGYGKKDSMIKHFAMGPTLVRDD